MSGRDLEKEMALSFLSGANMAYVDEMYEEYLTDKNAVAPEWKAFFDGLPATTQDHNQPSHRAMVTYFKALAERGTHSPVQSQVSPTDSAMAVEALIHAYRTYGHLSAKINPLDSQEHRQQLLKNNARLSLSRYGLEHFSKDQNITVHGYFSQSPMSLQQLQHALEATYCGSIGIEFTHMPQEQEVEWFAQKMESNQGRGTWTAEQKKEIFNQLVAADGLERYLGTRFVGQKRFSLEGGDAMIPMIKTMLNQSAEHGVREAVIGMAHRGRLNMLVNVFGKSPKALFEEFEGKTKFEGTGDVKYHMGFSSDIETPSKKIMHIALAFNPSHLEIIGPVVEGSVRARILRQQALKEKNKVLPILIHGDAAFIGQGVIMEMLNFSQIPGFCTGGTVHLVINNQIGFTTSDPSEARSTRYCTDVVKMIDAPVLHVNGNDPEAAVFAMQLALEYRQKFQRDVVVDLVCYRRHGHNEADEPMMTQPTMYQIIKTMPTLPELYGQELLAQGLVDEQAARTGYERYREKLDAGEPVVDLHHGPYPGKKANDWTPYMGVNWDVPVTTSLPLTKIQSLSQELQKLPQNFQLHPAIDRLMKEREKMTLGELPMNWGYAETLAYASLLKEGFSVRLSGEDAGRGTFAHRHAQLHDYATGQIYEPLAHVAEQAQQPFIVINNPLSEEAVLAFEYGYACSEPNALVLWEAQFGDFTNGAQVVIDQFISSGEQKWGRLCGLVLLLPHGYEGQGPEHSSARLERFMQLCAQHNMQVCVPTTPAQMFHLLRRQMIRPFRKPLIVMTPKSLLRHKLAVSTLTDLTEGQFQPIITDIDALNATQVTRVVLCSGKVYYDLLQKRRDVGLNSCALLRIEQLYPFPEKLLSQALAAYPNAKEIIWCQEEPENQGSWFASQHHIRHCMRPEQTLTYAGRPFAAAPAAGSSKMHALEQQTLVNQALDLSF
jgi:2-oxoglutarate dehydrogenase E1 component